MLIRKLDAREELPFDLLLLADETIESIEKYVYASDIYVLEVNGELIGEYTLCEIDNETVEIKNIAVKEEYQNQGFGKKLLNNAIEYSQRAGYKTLLICTGDAGYKQLAIYQKAGFQIFDKKENFFIENFSEPIFENGVQLKDMVMLKIEF